MITPLLSRILTIGLLFVAGTSLAQEPTTTEPNVTKVDTVKHWNSDGQLGLFLNQASFSENWKAGGVNSIAFGGVAQFAAKYQRENLSYTHDTQLTFGLVQNQGQGQRKTNDLIFVDNKVGYKFAAKWDFFGSVTFNSQFAQGFKYDKDAAGKETTTYVSNFLSPGYLTEALGVEYRPTSYASVRMGVGGLRHTIVTDTNIYRTVDGNYGVGVGQYVRTQAVFQLLATFDKDVAKNLNLKARYVSTLDYAKLNLISQGLVHRLDVSVTARVNRFVNVNLGAIFLYDYDQDKKVQYSQSLALGFLFKF
jgi:hypothetical protein